MISHTIITALVALCSAVASTSLVQDLLSPLRSVRGPWLARFTSAWFACKVSQGSFHQVNRDLHRQYGPIVRYGPKRYSISDLNEIKTIYGVGSAFPKSSWYTSWSEPGEHSVFSDRSIKRHAYERKLFQASYAMSALVHYEAFVDNCANLLKARLQELSSSSKPVDMCHWFRCYSFDVIATITYGKRLGFLDRGEDVGNMISAIDGIINYSSMTGIFPGLHQFLAPLVGFLAGGKGSGRRYLKKFTEERVLEGSVNPEKPMLADGDDGPQTLSQLSKFLAKHAADPDNFTKDHVKSGCLVNIAAGSDTTSISLSAVLYYLLKRPATMAKLRAEIDDATDRGELAENPTYKQSQQMPYLQAVIKEALRMHPATGLPLEREVPEGGATIAGQFFPQGTIVSVSIWVAHRDRGVFGQDADEFSPERWLQNDAETIARMNRFWMPFGVGSRTCLGRHISMLEMCKLLPLLVRDFDFSLPEDLSGKEWSTQGWLFIKPVCFNVLVQPRRREVGL
ncbi:cytochrome P450 [Microdochium trichocladiopsis]|uniref:Cytochrome P450 n=1 Tax=Microdochium trichocladiopsis TaxID=1682393 RepID=A0A9P8XS04_9PEZI|nr:cytochrome P450 [Microdochium trichocladiopsis]KAH7014186.1 cytochrome P450 [Microdochium trichocladiopsis]